MSKCAVITPFTPVNTPLAEPRSSVFGVNCSAPGTSTGTRYATTLPVGRGSVQSLKKYSPARVNVYWKLSPGFNFGLNNPSKNCVAQCGFRLGKLGNVAAP